MWNGGDFGQENSFSESSLEVEERVLRAQSEIHFVIAGKSGSGKSTVARNIFGANTRVTLSADPITLECVTHRVLKHGVTVYVTDTVGPQEGKATNSELKKYIKQHPKVDVLVYCVSINPGSKFADGNPAVMRSLQRAYGKDIWKHCVVIFTFSNYAWKWCEDRYTDEAAKVSEYNGYIHQYADRFKQELKSMKAETSYVHAVRDLELGPRNPSTLVAVLAGNKREDCVLPGFQSTKIRIQNRDGPQRMLEVKDWSDVLFIEIVKKCNSEMQKSLLRYRYKNEVIDILEGVAGGMAGGAAIGAGIGAGVGFAAGPAFPIASPIISAIGAATGAVLAGIAGATAGGGVQAKTAQNQ